MPFFERLNWNSILERSDDLHVWYQMKAYMCAKMKAKHTSIQKSHVFADPMHIFSENGSITSLKLTIETLEQGVKYVQS